MAADEGETTFDPVIARMIEGFRAGQSAAPLKPEDVPRIRERFAARGADEPLAAGVAASDIEVAGVPVRLYRPKGAGPWPLHLYLHGGGFIFGSARSSAGALSQRAADARCLVASVEYRLAPEHRFPAGLDDSYAALTGLLAEADRLGVDPHAVSVGGASSGGNFAAALCLMARDRGGPPIAFQLLEIAGTDLTKSSYAWRTPQPGHDTTRERDLVGVDFYLGDLTLRAHPYASPLFAPDLAGLPPAYVMNAEFDPRRDECEAYVARLQDAGVAAVPRTLARHVHGSMALADWPPAVAWRAEANAVLKAANAAALAGRPVTLEDATRP